MLGLKPLAFMQGITTNHMDLTDIYETCYPTGAEFTFFSGAHGTFPRTGHMLGHRASLNTFKRIAIMSGRFSGHSGTKLDVKNRRKSGKPTDTQN